MILPLLTLLLLQEIKYLHTSSMSSHLSPSVTGSLTQPDLLPARHIEAQLKLLYPHFRTSLVAIDAYIVCLSAEEFIHWTHIALADC